MKVDNYMVKTFVLDTNIILHDGECIFKFEDNNVIIPQPVLEEIDYKKHEQNELGRNARAFSRYLDDLRKKGNLIQGVSINEKSGKISIALFDQNVAAALPFQDMNITDNRILACAVFAKKNPFQHMISTSDIILVSNDTNMRIKADIFGIKAESYRNDRVNNDEIYAGIQILNVHQSDIEKAYSKKELTCEELQINEPFPNECFIIRNSANLKQTALLRYDGKSKVLKLLQNCDKTCDIIPRNVEQQFLLDILKDPSISLVSVNGKAGSGKTLMALTAAIYGVLEAGLYNKILLLKPIISMDNSHDIGFLPGSMEEKLAPWMASYQDNIEVIMGVYKDEDKDSLKPKKKKSKKEDDIYFEKQLGKTNPMQELIQHGLLEVGSLQHVRGRSLPKQFIILDESQNITKHAIKTIITRLGEGSKIVIMGDETQIDSPYLDSRSNALSIVSEVMKTSNITAHITLKKSERSELAELATELL